MFDTQDKLAYNAAYSGEKYFEYFKTIINSYIDN